MPLKIHDKAQKTFMVAGVFHSGTSFISKALLNSGVYMGRSIKSKYGDILEDYRITMLNRYILKQAGGNCIAIPEEEAISNVDVREQAKRNMERKREENYLSGFKDPRLCIVGEHYLPFMDGDPYLICCFRKTDRVMNSLERKTPRFADNQRKKGAFKNVRGFVDEYNKRLIKLIKKFVDL